MTKYYTKKIDNDIVQELATELFKESINFALETTKTTHWELTVAIKDRRRLNFIHDRIRKSACK